MPPAIAIMGVPVIHRVHANVPQAPVSASTDAPSRSPASSDASSGFFAEEQLQDRAFGTGRLAGRNDRFVAEHDVPAKLGAGVQPRQPLANDRIGVATLTPGEVDEPADRIDGRVVGARPDGSPFGHQRRDDGPPPGPQLTDAVGVGDAYLVEEHLVEVLLTRHLTEWAHRDARQVHVEEEHRQSLVLAHVWIGAGEQLTDLGEVGLRRPHLLARHHPLVAVAHGARAQRGEVRPGFGFAEELAHQQVAAEDAREVPALQIGAAVGQHGRRDQSRASCEGLLIGDVERALEHAVLLVERGAATATSQLDRTGEPAVPAVEHQPAPCPGAVEGGRLLALIVVAVEQADRVGADAPSSGRRVLTSPRMRLEEVQRLVAERRELVRADLLVIVLFQVHRVAHVSLMCRYMSLSPIGNPVEVLLNVIQESARRTYRAVTAAPRARARRRSSAEERRVLQHGEVDDPAGESGRSTEGPGGEVARREPPTFVGADRLVVVEAEELDATVAPAPPLGDREPGETLVAVDPYEPLVHRLEDEVHAGGGSADHVGNRCSPDGVVGCR